MNRQEIKTTSLFSFIILVSFFLCSYVGIKINELFFNTTLGKPEELDWFLLLYSSILIGIISGITGSLIITSIIGFTSRRSFHLKGMSLGKILLRASCFALLWIVLIIIIYGFLTPPCPNCYK